MLAYPTKAAACGPCFVHHRLNVDADLAVSLRPLVLYPRQQLAQFAGERSVRVADHIHGGAKLGEAVDKVKATQATSHEPARGGSLQCGPGTPKADGNSEPCYLLGSCVAGCHGRRATLALTPASDTVIP